MLKLERMVISGFKSFGDQTEVTFRDGINAVVGPNGCGKSNIGDAINWVLGERSPKTLRGAQMADVIFNGTRQRKAMGMAEVSLHLGGAEGLKQNEQGKIVATRRLFRSGESEYLLNGARVRLKDIQELLHAARISSKSYATIEQGKIDQVLNAKPRDRRVMIEDAAGIAGYKQKRRLTELKLEATTANLLRVNDIVVEVRRQINSLKRQASKARRYKRLRDELRGKEQIRFTLRLRELEAQLTQERELETQARDCESAAAAALAKLEVEVLEERSELDKAVSVFRESAEQLHRLEIEIDRAEAQIRTCKERIVESGEAEQRQRSEAEELAGRQSAARNRAAEHQLSLAACSQELERIAQSHQRNQREFEGFEASLLEKREQVESLRKQQFEAMHSLAGLRNQLGSVEEALERSAGQRERLGGERTLSRTEYERASQKSAAIATDVGTHEQVLEAKRAAFSQSEEGLRQARSEQSAVLQSSAEVREREKSTLARLQTLRDVSTRFTGISEGAKVLLGGTEAAAVQSLGVVADFIEGAGTEIETAAECYLGWLLPALIVEDDAEVQRAADLIHSEGAGRTSLISQTQPAGTLAVGSPRNGHGPLPQSLLEDRRVLGKLLDKVKLDATANGSVAKRIGDAVLVDSLQSALDLHREYPEVDYLVQNGDVVYASGVIAVNGRQAEDHGLLTHNRLVHEAASEVSEASAEALRIKGVVGRLQSEVVRLEIEVGERREELERAEVHKLELRHQAEQAAEERERTGKRTRVLDDELTALSTELERLTAEREKVREQLAVAEEAGRTLEETLQLLTEELDQHERLLRQSSEQLSESRADLAARQQKQSALELEGGRLAQEIEELTLRLTALCDDAALSSGRVKSAADLQSGTERELIEQLAERERLARETAAMEQANDERRRLITEWEESLRKARAALEALREDTHEKELERSRVESAREHLDDLCRQELGAGAAETAAEIGEECGEVDLELLEAELEELKLKLERLGPVNMTAIEEFSDLEERQTFLTTQKQDLERSMASLRETIQRINRESRQRFLEAFEAVRLYYKEIFRLLFDGGQADLKLEEGDDVLECGIEILAQPPGKRLTGVQLLSGGEKALSAIALLFAIFRYQPSPFCLLDEVDAALDDSNVDRFSRMLREYSDKTQFILITHNKHSMESADLLYGVTMEEPGVSKLISVELN